jgi:type I restriction enzyme S subunit
MTSDTIQIRDTDIEIVDGDRGVNYPKKSEFSKNGYCLFLDASNITTDGLKIIELQFISKQRDELLGNGKLMRHDIVLTTRGTIGNLGYFGNDVPYEHIRINSGMLILRCGSDFVAQYLYHLLRSSFIKKQISNITTGSSQPQLTKTIVQDLKLFKPEIPTQKAIARVLTILDDKIALNNKINSELEKTARLIYNYWFTQFDFPDSNGKPYKSSGGIMAYSLELKREIPYNWSVKPLKQIAKIIMGQSPRGSSYNDVQSGVPLLNGPADYEDGSLMGRIFTTEPTRLCTNNDLVFCIRATIGNLVYAEKEFCLGRGVAAVRVNDIKMSEIIYYALLQEIERFKIQAGGSIIIGITKDDLTDSNILIPDQEMISTFHGVAKPLFNKIRLNKAENLDLVRLRDWLLPMLITGQVKVK